MIPSKLYKKIVELVPIVCVDIVVYYKGKFLLVKRSTEPLKGIWWIPGGRMLKGETTLKTAKRKIKEELGLKIKHLRPYGIYEDHYKKSAWGVPTSSVSVVYIGIVNELNIVPDKTVLDTK